MLGISLLGLRPHSPSSDHFPILPFRPTPVCTTCQSPSRSCTKYVKIGTAEGPCKPSNDGTSGPGGRVSPQLLSSLSSRQVTILAIGSTSVEMTNVLVLPRALNRWMGRPAWTRPSSKCTSLDRLCSQPSISRTLPQTALQPTFIAPVNKPQSNESNN